MKTDGSTVGATISLNNDGTITREGVTLGQNSDQIFTNAAGSEFYQDKQLDLTMVCL